MPNRKATLTTNKGAITFELDEEHAPITSANFISLAQSGFYNGLTFHRYEPGFVIQGGDPLGNGTGSSKDKIKLETTGTHKHDSAGTVAMARSQDPNSASCQFYITLAAATFLDNNYATFGKVTDGLDVVLQLRKGDRIDTVTIE